MDAYFARQPILDAEQQLFGYELLFRPSLDSTTSGENIVRDGDQATTGLLDSINWDNIDKITGGKYAFVNFTGPLLLNGMAMLYPKDYLVVEILESVEIDDALIEAVQQLKKKGYRIALDDYVYRKQDMPLLELCDIVKVEVDGSERKYRNIKDVAKAIGRKRCRLLAEKVETPEMFETAKQLGCSLFQGFYFARPKIVHNRIVSPMKINQLRLIREITRKDANFEKLANIIKNDVALSYKTLRLVNSAYYGPRDEVKGINQAVAILGLNEMKKWLTYSSISELCDDKPSELVVMSLMRAAFCERLATKMKMGSNKEAYFLTGLFSLLDVLTDATMESCLESISVPVITRKALLEEDNTGRRMLDLIIALEHGNWMRVSMLCKELHINESSVADIYMESINWAQSFS